VSLVLLFEHQAHIHRGVAGRGGLRAAGAARWRPAQAGHGRDGVVVMKLLPVQVALGFLVADLGAGQPVISSTGLALLLGDLAGRAAVVATVVRGNDESSLEIRLPAPP
jgi:hypothetical protein